MDPVAVNAIVGAVGMLLMNVISLIVYHKFWLPGSSAVTPTQPVSLPGLLNSSLLSTALQHGTDTLSQLATQAVKSAVSQIILPALAKSVQQIGTSLEAGIVNTAVPTVPPTKAA